MPTKLDGHHLTCLLGAGVFLGHASHACGQSMDQVLSRAALNPSGTGDDGHVWKPDAECVNVLPVKHFPSPPTLL